MRAEAVADTHELRRILGRLIEAAEGLRDQMRRGGAPNGASNALMISLLKAQAFASSIPLPYSAELVFAEPDAAPDSAGERADVEALVAALRARYRRVEAALAAWVKEEERADPAAGLSRDRRPGPRGRGGRVPMVAQMARLDEEMRGMEARREVAVARNLELIKRRNREQEALFTLEDNLLRLGVDDVSRYPEVRLASPAVMAQRTGLNPVVAAVLAGGLGAFAMTGRRASARLRGAASAPRASAPAGSARAPRRPPNSLRSGARRRAARSIRRGPPRREIAPMRKAFQGVARSGSHARSSRRRRGPGPSPRPRRRRGTAPTAAARETTAARKSRNRTGGTIPASPAIVTKRLCAPQGWTPPML